MTYEETVAIVYRILNAYPTQTRNFTENVIKGMAREWHTGMKNISSAGAMEAITMLTTEQKWMPSLSEVILKILDVQYGKDADVVRELDEIISHSSTCIIFGEVTEDQVRGFESLSAFYKMIIRSPYEFSMWMMKDYEWKQSRVLQAKREVQYGSHKTYLNSPQSQVGNQIGESFIKALAEKNNYGNK